MTISRSAARPLLRVIRAARLSRLILAAAMIAAGLGSLTLAAHVRRAGAPAHELRSTQHGDGIVPPVAKAYTLANSAPHPSAAAFDPKYRFGFLEFEDAPE